MNYKLRNIGVKKVDIPKKIDLPEEIEADIDEVIIYGKKKERVLEKEIKRILIKERIISRMDSVIIPVGAYDYEIGPEVEEYSGMYMLDGWGIFDVYKTGEYDPYLSGSFIVWGYFFEKTRERPAEIELSYIIIRDLEIIED